MAKTDRFDGYAVSVLRDEDGDWLAHFMELPNVSAFGPTPEKALKELDVAWALVKEDYAAEGKPRIRPQALRSEKAGEFGQHAAKPRRDPLRLGCRLKSHRKHK